MDVDGVLTDGGIYYGARGEELKKFNVHDGYGALKLRRAGISLGVITGRVSPMVERRATELGFEEMHQNLENKLEAYESILAKHGLQDHEVAYIGDDDPDIPVLKRVGFSAAPANAMRSVKNVVDYVCKAPGGAGVMREVAELLLKSRT